MVKTIKVFVYNGIVLWKKKNYPILKNFEKTYGILFLGNCTHPVKIKGGGGEVLGHR